MDYDVLTNISFNFTFDSSDGIPAEESMSMIFHEIIFSIICLVGIIANGLIIYIINRFKNMKTCTNIYIMNWLASDTVYFLITPCFYRIFSALENLFIGEEIVCIAFELASVLQITSILFILILCINWFIDVYTLHVFRQSYKYVIILVWAAALSAMVSFTTYCAMRQYTLISHYLLFFGYAALMCLVIVMYITKHYTKQFMQIHEKLQFNLILVSVYVVCWFPSWLCLLVGSFMDSHFGLYYYSIVAACLGYLNPLANLYLFAKMNKHFRMALMQVCKCVTNDYNDASHSFEDSDDNQDDDDNFNNVQVTSLNDNIHI